MQAQTEIVIDAPAHVAWEVLSDVVRWPEWTRSVRAVEPLSERPLQVGRRYRIRQPRLPVAVWEVTELVPGRSFQWVNRSPGLTSTGTHLVAAEDDARCRAVLAIDQAGPLSFLARPWSGLTSRYVQMEAAGLKARSEVLAAAG